MTGTHSPIDPAARGFILQHSLVRRSDSELYEAMVILSMVARDVTEGLWSSEGPDLHKLLEKHCDGREARAQSVAVRCVYVEYAPEPVIGLKLTEMMKVVGKWERKLWREPGHVRLGMERCVARLVAELERRKKR